MIFRELATACSLPFPADRAEASCFVETHDCVLADEPHGLGAVSGTAVARLQHGGKQMAELAEMKPPAPTLEHAAID